MLKPKISTSTLATVCKGFAMGCADVVPGVSGGTVALVVGIYDRLVAGIQSVVLGVGLLAKFKIKAGLARMDLAFLIPLLSGIALAIVTMAKLITKCMNDYPELTWGLFLGLMIGSVILVGRKVTETRLHLYAITICSAFLAALITCSTPVETPETPFLFFASGAIAIVAMILPGISGSFLLLIMGKYLQVMEAINSVVSHLKLALSQIFHGDSASALEAVSKIGEVLLQVIIPFGSGCVIGLAAFSWILGYLLKNYRNMMMSSLLGLMIGTLHKLWPFREVTLYLHREGHADKILQDVAVAPYWNDPIHGMAMGLVLLGIVVVLGVERLGQKE
jgi:putative membrane protein